ncbi:hypothetical protein ACWJJH_15850 [Endozoicomonadaceae bacterium StTr2]
MLCKRDTKEKNKVVVVPPDRYEYIPEEMINHYSFCVLPKSDIDIADVLEDFVENCSVYFLPSTYYLSRPVMVQPGNQYIGVEDPNFKKVHRVISCYELFGLCQHSYKGFGSEYYVVADPEKKKTQSARGVPCFIAKGEAFKKDPTLFHMSSGSSMSMLDLSLPGLSVATVLMTRLPLACQDEHIKLCDIAFVGNYCAGSADFTGNADFIIDNSGSDAVITEKMKQRRKTAHITLEKVDLLRSLSCFLHGASGKPLLYESLKVFSEWIDARHPHVIPLFCQALQHSFFPDFPALPNSRNPWLQPSALACVRGAYHAGLDIGDIDEGSAMSFITGFLGAGNLSVSSKVIVLELNERFSRKRDMGNFSWLLSGGGKASILDFKCLQYEKVSLQSDRSRPTAAFVVGVETNSPLVLSDGDFRRLTSHFPPHLKMKARQGFDEVIGCVLFSGSNSEIKSEGRMTFFREVNSGLATSFIDFFIHSHSEIRAQIQPVIQRWRPRVLDEESGILKGSTAYRLLFSICTEMKKAGHTSFRLQQFLGLLDFFDEGSFRLLILEKLNQHLCRVPGVNQVRGDSYGRDLSLIFANKEAAKKLKTFLGSQRYWNELTDPRAEDHSEACVLHQLLIAYVSNVDGILVERLFQSWKVQLETSLKRTQSMRSVRDVSANNLKFSTGSLGRKDWRSSSLRLSQPFHSSGNGSNNGAGTHVNLSGTGKYRTVTAKEPVCSRTDAEALTETVKVLIRAINARNLMYKLLAEPCLKRGKTIELALALKVGYGLMPETADAVISLQGKSEGDRLTMLINGFFEAGGDAKELVIALQSVFKGNSLAIKNLCSSAIMLRKEIAI